jgi:hypothetical protein
MTTILVDSQKIGNVQTFIGTPIGGDPSGADQRRALTWTVDYSAGGTITANASLQSFMTQSSRLQYIQSIRVDNSFNDAQVDVYFPASQEHIRIAPNAISVHQVNVAAPADIVMTCSGGTGIVGFVVTNVKMDPITSSTVSVSGPFIFNGSGYLLVADPILDGCVLAGELQVAIPGVTSGGALNVNPATVGGTFTDRTVMSTAAATSTQLMAANAARKYVIIGAPQTEGVWINPRGGTAGPNLTGCFFLNAGLIWEKSSPSDYIWQSAIYYYTTSGALVLPAGEA